MVEGAVYFPRECSVSEANSEFVGIDETCSYDLDDGATAAGSALGLDLEHSDGRVQQGGVAVGKHIGEDPVICVLFNSVGRLVHRESLMASEALAPRVRPADLVDSVGGILAASYLREKWELFTV